MSIISNYLEFTQPEIDRGEILRYMCCKKADYTVDEIIDKCLHECLSLLSYKVIYVEMPISFSDGGIKLGELETKSLSLQKNLSGCERAIVFASTIGLGIDRLIVKYSRISPSTAVCFQAIGAERIEALCNAFCNGLAEKLAESGERIRPRFSPGYGDLPLSLQKNIFNILECEKRLGLTLNDSLMISPTKSVTAIVGIYK